MRIDKFNGLNNQQAPNEFGLGGMVQAQNVDITDSGKVRLRNGRTKLAVASISAAWSSGEGDVLYQSGNTLYLMQNGQPVLSQSVLSGVSSTGELRGVKLNGKLYWSNGVQSGVIFNQSNLSLGVKTPDTPSAVQFFGLMPLGRYMYAVTNVRVDGFESSAGLSGLIDITEGAIDVSNPVYSSDILYHNLYLTTANGETLYYAGRFNAGNHLIYAGNTLDLNTPLKYQFCDQPPHFNLATFYRGRMYYAKGGLVVASKPMNYEMVDYANDYLQFDGIVTLLHGVEAGIYVGTNKETFFLSGNSINEFSLNKKLDYGAILGTDKRVYASTINSKQSGNVVLWGSNRGLIAGFDDGQVVNLTDGVFAFDNVDKGTSTLKEENGLRQYLVTLP